MTDQHWNALLAIAFPSIDQARREASELAREFYDSVREDAAPTKERHSIDLEPYFFEWLQQRLEPAKRDFVAGDAPDSALEAVTGLVTKEVEDSGRRTIIRGVDSDPQATHWARYDPKQPTCAFCIMLISRGPVYKKETAQFLSHKHCTCKAVPVFKGQRKSWPGYEQYKEANGLWVASTSGHSGKAALDAFRRALSEKNKQNDATKRLAS